MTLHAIEGEDIIFQSKDKYGKNYSIGVISEVGMGGNSHGVNILGMLDGMGGMGCVQPFRTTWWGREAEECSAWLRLVSTFQDKQPEWDTRQEQRQMGIEG